MEPKYITANKDVNIIYDQNKKEFYLKVPKTCLLKCEVPKNDFMRKVEKCFNKTPLERILTKESKAILRLSISPNGGWKVSFSPKPLEIIEFSLKVTSTDITPQEAGEILYNNFLTCNGKVAVDITLWYY